MLTTTPTDSAIQHPETENGWFRFILEAPRRLFSWLWSSGLVCIAIAALTFSIAAACVRPLGDELPVLEIVAVRSGLSLIFSFLAAQTSPKESPLFGERKHLPLLAARGLIGAAAMDCFYASLTRLPLGDAISLFFCNPALTALLAAIFLKESLSWKGVLGCLCSLVGMVTIIRPPFLFHGKRGWSTERAVGSAFAMGSAVLASLAFLAIRIIGKREPALTMAVWFHTSAFSHSVLLLLVGWPVRPVVPRVHDIPFLFTIAVSSFIGNILISRGLQQVPAAVGSAINYTQVIYSVIWGSLFFGETIQALGVVGAVAIAIGVVTVALDSKKNKSLQENGEEEASPLLKVEMTPQDKPT